MKIAEIKTGSNYKNEDGEIRTVNGIRKNGLLEWNNGKKVGHCSTKSFAKWAKEVVK